MILQKAPNVSGTLTYRFNCLIPLVSWLQPELQHNADPLESAAAGEVKKAL